MYINLRKGHIKTLLFKWQRVFMLGRSDILEFHQDKKIWKLLLN